MSLDIFKSLNLEGLNLNFWEAKSNEEVRLPESQELPPEPPLNKEFVEDTFTRVGSVGFSRVESNASERRRRYGSPDVEFKRTRSRESVASQTMAYQNALQELQELKKENNMLHLMKKKYVYRRDRLLSTEENAHMTFAKEAPRSIVEEERTRIHGYVDSNVSVPTRKSGDHAMLEISRNRTSNFRCASPVGTLVLRDCDSVFVMVEACSKLYIENCSHSRVVVGSCLPPASIVSSEDCVILCHIDSDHRVSISSSCSKGIVIRYLERAVEDAVALLESQAEAKSVTIPCLLNANVHGTIIECSLKLDDDDDDDDPQDQIVQFLCRKDLLLVDSERSYTRGAGETFIKVEAKEKEKEKEEIQPQQPQRQREAKKPLKETKRVIPNATFRRRKNSVID
ncbi:hypothetical protein GUITHDRAFT_149246 [Guillardia theta CCMP2712]|uniref:C-CAP/cofactor C-like domain-containing protein n=1 Tax=Guillardia theta (strain CCMP2712) TaxID=905079 RepID=L1I6M2_GUITC|nr:hypothetical protein GUITHDRAFT_149246 [Guillardia theta CCMP2712]EKX31515.1 hypothetical protein GUITHDRAFT_149246 [Guillardia theta CCMP2712]|eukprot:XP_005818495.1 hypothetical protein GUITHDRAFT_149246 [Guillardia theta CCMP2712]